MLLEDIQLGRVEILEEATATKPMKIRGVFQRAEEPNKNKRIYPRSVLEASIETLKPTMQSRQLLGELDHPAEGVVKLQNASHLITNLSWKGNDMIGEAEILNTPAGKIAQALIRDGVQIGISSRGQGSLSEANSEGYAKVNEDYRMITFDLVADPSTKGAFPSLAEAFIRKSIIPVIGEEKLVKAVKRAAREKRPAILDEDFCIKLNSDSNMEIINERYNLEEKSDEKVKVDFSSKDADKAGDFRRQGKKKLSKWTTFQSRLTRQKNQNRQGTVDSNRKKVMGEGSMGLKRIARKSKYPGSLERTMKRLGKKDYKAGNIEQDEPQPNIYDKEVAKASKASRKARDPYTKSSGVESSIDKARDHFAKAKKIRHLKNTGISKVMRDRKKRVRKMEEGSLGAKRLTRLSKSKGSTHSQQSNARLRMYLKNKGKSPKKQKSDLDMLQLNKAGDARRSGDKDQAKQLIRHSKANRDNPIQWKDAAPNRKKAMSEEWKMKLSPIILFEGSLGLKRLNRIMKSADKKGGDMETFATQKLRKFTDKERRRSKGNSLKKVMQRPAKYRGVNFAKGKMSKYGDGDDIGTMSYRAARDHTSGTRGTRRGRDIKGRDD